MHRLIAGAARGEEVDHKDGDGLNNRRVNLRICTRRQNNMNRKKGSGCSSNFKGVSYFKRHPPTRGWRRFSSTGCKCTLGILQAKWTQPTHMTKRLFVCSENLRGQTSGRYSLMDGDTFSTGEVAELIGCCRATVVRLIAQGHIQAIRRASKAFHRRVSRFEMIRYLLKHGMRDRARELGWKPLLALCSVSDDMRRRLTELVQHNLNPVACDSTFSIPFGPAPVAVVIDVANGRAFARKDARVAKERWPNCRVAAVCYDDEATFADPISDCCDLVFMPPHNVEQIAEALCGIQ
jgi:excisionase family DNA binding protein